MNINDTINAFANSWKSIIAVGLIVLIIVFNKQFKELLGRLKKIKIEKGDNKAEIECSPADIVTTDNSSNAENMKLNVEKEKNEIIKPDIVESEIIFEEEEEEINDKSLYNAYLKRDIEKVKHIFSELEKKEKNNVAQLKNKAFYLCALFNLGETSAINELIELAEQNNDHKEFYYVNRMLASCYERTNQLERASQCYIAATLSDTSEMEKSRDIISNADVLRQLGSKTEAYTVIKDAIQSLKDRNAVFDLYIKLAKYYEEDNEKIMSFIAYEKALELQPNNTDTYFSLAYSYSEDKLWKVLGLFLYKNLLNFDPKSNGALNNLAVAYSELGLNAKAVENYKKSFEEGNSLAGANLAYVMMNSGLTEDANLILEKAERLGNVHQNVKSAVIRLKEIKDEENKKETNLFEQASIKQRFFRNYGEICFNKNDLNYPLQGSWKADDKVNISLYEEEGNVIGTLMIADKERKLICETNYSYSKFKIKLKYYDLKLNAYSYKDDGTGYMYISKDCEKLNIMLLFGGDCIMYNMERCN